MLNQIAGYRVETPTEYRERRIRNLNYDIFELERRLEMARKERAELLGQ